MNINEIIKYVSKSAPLLGSVLGGPIGGTAGIALSLIANMFNANPKDPAEIFSKMAEDPEAEIKLQQLEFQHKENLLQIQTQNYSREVDDRIDARKFNMAYLLRNGKFPPMLWFLVIMVFLCMAGCAWGVVKFPTLTQMLDLLFMTCILELKNIYKLFTGGALEDQQSKNQLKNFRLDLAK